jgi:hypothetical protein
LNLMSAKSDDRLFIAGNDDAGVTFHSVRSQPPTNR